MTWTEALDTFAERLAELDRAVDEGLPEPVTGFEPPEDLGDLPPEFADRARDLVWRCRALEDRITEALTAAQARLDRVGAQPAAGRPAEPMFFDSRV